MKGQFDGRMMKYRFGDGRKLRKHSDRTFPVFEFEARTLAHAVRAFRTACLYPHSYTDAPAGAALEMSPHRYQPTEACSNPECMYGRCSSHWFEAPRWLESEAGATIPVFALDGKKTMRAKLPDGTETVDGVTRPRYRTWEGPNWVEVTRIPPEGADAGEAYLKQLPERLTGSFARGADETALAVSIDGVLAGLNNASRIELTARRTDIARRQSDLLRMKRELEVKERELRLQVDAMKRELKARLDQIWAIELFLGSKEQVKCLAEGTPAPPGTPITIRQRVLCMDEELAVHDWFNNPDRIGFFGAEDLDSFDRWVIAPSALRQVFPHSKGIVGLKVRRTGRIRFGARWAFSSEDDPDAMTYLLIVNGQNVYRIWADVKLWPRFFARLNEFDWLRSSAFQSDRDKAEEVQKRYLGGLVVVQGLIERSDLFEPVRPGTDVFDPLRFEDDFVAVRDDEPQGLALTDGDKLKDWTWPRYRDWLRSKLADGVRVLWEGHHDSYSRISFEEARTGIRSLDGIPSESEPYVLNVDGTHMSFLYMPDSPVWRGGRLCDRMGPRARRVRWTCYPEELMPIDFVSWRVLEHLMRDRNARTEYRDFFALAWQWYKLARERAAREAPFVTLILTRAGAEFDDPKARARCERLIRWWRLKTKQHRDLGDDEPKALRMIVDAYKRGLDYDEDPEKELFA